MSPAQSLFEEVRAFLRLAFRGSTLSDGYSFILFEAPVARRLRSGMVQQAASLMASGPCWLLMVGRDPSGLVSVRRMEEDETIWNPDWNVWERRRIFACDLAGPPDIEALLRLTDAAEALALISPGLGVCLHAGQRAVFAQTREALAVFDACLESPDEAI